jgi:transcription elongation factor Elf1
MTTSQDIWTTAVIQSLKEWRKTNPTPAQINQVIDALACQIDTMEDIGRISVLNGARTMDATAYILHALMDIYNDIDDMIEAKKVQDKIDFEDKNDRSDFCPQIITIGPDDQPKNFRTLGML